MRPSPGQRRPVSWSMLLMGLILLSGSLQQVSAQDDVGAGLSHSNGEIAESEERRTDEASENQRRGGQVSGWDAEGEKHEEHEEDGDEGHDHEGHDHEGHDHGGHDHEGHDHEGHDHVNCGYNTAVKPWMEQTLRDFDTAREASRRMAKTRASVASSSRVGGGTQEAAPIRIHTEFQLGDMQDYSKRYFLKYQLVPRMVAEIRRRMLVKQPVQGNLQVPRYCSLYYVREDGEYNCAEVADQEYCSAPDVGIKHNPEFLDGFTICSDASKGSCRAQEGGAGAKDADFILYVAANDVGYCRQGHIVAFAGTCALDLDSNRPLAGFANFCPGNIDTSPRAFQDLLETAVHEALHALFFSELLFPYYLDENGEQRKGVVKEDPNGNKMVVTPSVARAARNHFGCSDLEGAPLENEGGIGTAGNHWESRVFQGELMDGMSGAPNERAVFSAITMALIDDSGWYSAAWELQGNLGFGKDAGCSFLDKGCNHNKWFCSAGSREDSCSWDLKSVGRCSSELLLDGCSAPVAYRNMHCLQASLFEERKTSDSWMWGFGYGADARCMKEIGPVAKVPGDGYRYTKFSNSTNLECYKFSCPDGKLHVLVDDHELPCPTGEEVDLTGIGYLSGRLGPCPDNARLCDQLSCPNLCSGNGDCHGGRCTCNLGYSGDDCAHSTCLPNSCPQGLACNYVTGLCEGDDNEKAGHCPSSTQQSHGNSSNYGVIDYLLDISAGALSDCYTSTLPTSEQPPSLVDDVVSQTPPLQPRGDVPSLPPTDSISATEAPVSVPFSSDTDKDGDNQTVPRVTVPSRDTRSAVDGTPGRSPSLSEWDDPVVGDPANDDQQGGEAGSATGDKAGRDGARTGAVDGELIIGGGDISDGRNAEGRVRVTLQLRQLLGSAPLSQSQADQMLLILAASAGVSEGSVEYVALTPPAASTGVYVVVAEVTTSSSATARVASSLRTAASYGILESRLREESSLECVSTEVKDMVDGGSGGLSAVAVKALFGVLGVAAVVIIVGTALLVCRCRRAAAEQSTAEHFTDITKEPKTVEIASRGSAGAGSTRRMLLPSDAGCGVNTVASISPAAAATQPISARQQHVSSSHHYSGERPLRDRYCVSPGGSSSSSSSTPLQHDGPRSATHQSRPQSRPHPPMSAPPQGGRGRQPRS